MRGADWGMLLILALEIPSLLSSQYRANSIRTSWAVMIAVLVYYAVRLTVRTPLQIACLSGLLGLGGGWLALSGVRQFDKNAKLLGAAGFTNLVAFRSRLFSPSSPWIPGEWFTLLLLALPFACALPAYLWAARRTWLAASSLLCPLLITASLVLSLSRGVFWSTVLCWLTAYVLMTWYRVIAFRTGALLLVSAIGALVLILACESAFYPGIFNAYAGQHTSQVRSTEGRVGIWSRSFQLFRTHPLWGVGSSNAALALISTSDQEETAGFASRTFSLPVQVLVEKGSIGFLLYAAVLLVIAREFTLTMRYSPSRPAVAASGGPRINTGQSSRDPLALPADQSRHRAMACCFAAGLVAVVFREMTYSSLLEHSLTLVLTAALCALMCSPERGT
jgi:O-antigen ligase